MSKRERFIEFHSNNPHVFAWLRKRALEKYEEGRERYSPRRIVSDLRYEAEELEIDRGPETFRLPDEFMTPYGRLLAVVEPQVEGMLGMREAPTWDFSDNWIEHLVEDMGQAEATA